MAKTAQEAGVLCEINIKGSLAGCGPSASAMCYRNEYHLRCGHRRISPLLHCTSATRNPQTGRWNKCRARTSKYKIESEELCGDEDDCQLSACKGRWICCKCRFGYKHGEVNRIMICVE